MNLVLLILDPHFGDNPTPLPHLHPVWVVESEANRGALKNSSTALGPLTWFPRRDGESASEVFARIVQSVDQHHNELSQIPPYDTLDVYGLPEAADMLDSVTDLGFTTQMKRSGVTRFLKGSKTAANAPE